MDSWDLTSWKLDVTECSWNSKNMICVKWLEKPWKRRIVIRTWLLLEGFSWSIHLKLIWARHYPPPSSLVGGILMWSVFRPAQSRGLLWCSVCNRWFQTEPWTFHPLWSEPTGSLMSIPHFPKPENFYFNSCLQRKKQFVSTSLLNPQRAQ